MNVLFEGHHVDVLPEWRQQVEQRLAELSDPRDPVINARCSVSYKATEIPPADCSLNISLRGRNIVVSKRGDHVDGALKLTLDTAKREIRKFYDLRSNHRPKSADSVLSPAPLEAPPVEDPEDLDDLDLELFESEPV